MLKVCWTPGPTACSKTKMLHFDKVCLKVNGKEKKFHDYIDLKPAAIHLPPICLSTMGYGHSLYSAVHIWYYKVMHMLFGDAVLTVIIVTGSFNWTCTVKPHAYWDKKLCQTSKGVGLWKYIGRMVHKQCQITEVCWLQRWRFHCIMICTTPSIRGPCNEPCSIVLVYHALTTL